ARRPRHDCGGAAFKGWGCRRRWARGLRRGERECRRILPGGADGKRSAVALDKLDGARRCQSPGGGNDRLGDAVEPARDAVDDLAQKLHREPALGSSSMGPSASLRHDNTRYGAVALSKFRRITTEQLTRRRFWNSTPTLTRIALLVSKVAPPRAGPSS